MSDFFGKTFWQMLLVQSISSIVTLAIAIVASLYIGSQIEKLNELADSINTAMETMLKLVELGPEGINEVGAAIQENAENTGASLGDGGAIVVDKVGTALDKFLAPKE